jgi:hypothetical protein
MATYPLTFSKCKVCGSPRRVEYERLRLREKKTLRGLAKLAREAGENINKSTFGNHFKKHVMDRFETERESREQRELLTEETWGKLFALFDELGAQISTLEKKISSSRENAQIGKLFLEQIDGLARAFKRLSPEAAIELHAAMKEEGLFDYGKILQASPSHGASLS